MNIDLSLFPQIGQFIFDCAVSLYKSLNFDFGGFVVNGWVLLLGVAIVCIIVWFLGRISE